MERQRRIKQSWKMKLKTCGEILCAGGEREAEDTSCVTEQGVTKGGQGDEVVIKKCKI